MSDTWYIVNVEAAIYRGDEWLIIKRSLNEEHAPGMLSLVGGKVDGAGIEQDILEKTLIREVREEVGIEVKDLTYLESKSFKTDQGKLVVDIVMICEYQSGNAVPVSQDEVEEVLWMKKEDICQCHAAPDYVKETIKHADTLRLAR